MTGQIPMPAWLGDPRLILSAAVLWGFPWVGSFAVLTHLAKLGGIGKQIYEAAEIDGVSWWSKFWHIELPLIGGSIYVLLVFVIIETIRDAGMIIALADIEGGPGGYLTVPALFMIRKAFVEQQMGYACAIGIVLTLIVMGLQKGTTIWMDRERAKRVQWITFQVIILAVAGLLLYFGKFIPLALLMIFLAFPKRITAIVLVCAWGITHGQAYFNKVAVFFGCLIEGKDAVNPETLPYGPVLTLLILLLALPYRSIGAWLVRIKPIGNTWNGYVEWREQRRERAIRHQQIRVPGFSDKLKEYAARGAKHLTIWLVLGFAFLPVYLMIIVSLKDNQQFYTAPAHITQPLHWENWLEAWQRVSPSVANSIYISSCATVLILFLAMSGAYFFARLKMPMSNFFWNAILILMMMPTIANLVPLFRLLANLNLLNTLTALILVNASAGQIAAIFVLRNFIGDVPQDLFEAAEIDGASHFRQMLTIVAPLSGPILGTVGVMQFIVVWNDFVLPLIVIRDHAKLPVMVQLLRMNGEYIKLWGPLMAGYAFASIPVIVLFTFTMRLFVRGMTEGAVKN